jgi:phosphoribosylglycinamide formyltransferase 2
MKMPRRNHQTESLLNPKSALGEEKGTPLSVRMALGNPYFWNVCSKMLKAYFSELSPRPHDTGMVTLAGSQNLNEFELHARAVLGLPIPQIELKQNAASAVVLADTESEEAPHFSGLNIVLQDPKAEVRIFGKPNTRPYRRMAVALAFGQESVQEITERAKAHAAQIKLS